MHRQLSRFDLLNRLSLKCSLVASLLLALSSIATQADEQLFGWMLGSETLPKGHAEVYQYITLRIGKAEGTYRAFDFETEVEYGFTDKFQGNFSVEQHHFYNNGVSGDRDALDDIDSYRFGGLALAGKYNILSPFKDPIGLAIILQSEYKLHDEVDGLKQHEIIVYPNFILQKNFLDDTLIFTVNTGVGLAWGKKPAEQYAYELAATGGLGVSYRFAPNWYFGLESQIRSEYPRFNLGDHEHTVIYAGPTLHYGTKWWWATLSWGHQIYGSGIDEPDDGKTFAEEQRNQIRLKFGANF